MTDKYLEEIKMRCHYATEDRYHTYDELVAEVERLKREYDEQDNAQHKLFMAYCEQKKQIAILKKALTELVQTGQYTVCELCGADCIDAGLDFVDEMSQCGCFKLRDNSAGTADARNAGGGEK